VRFVLIYKLLRCFISSWREISNIIIYFYFFLLTLFLNHHTVTLSLILIFLSLTIALLFMCFNKRFYYLCVNYANKHRYKHLIYDKFLKNYTTWTWTWYNISLKKIVSYVSRHVNLKINYEYNNKSFTVLLQLLKKDVTKW